MLCLFMPTVFAMAQSKMRKKIRKYKRKRIIINPDFRHYMFFAKTSKPRRDKSLVKSQIECKCNTTDNAAKTAVEDQNRISCEM